MQFQDAVQLMSTHYLRRVLESYREESRKPDEEEARQRLLQDEDSITDPQNIQARVNLHDLPFDEQTLCAFVAEALLEAEDYSLDEKAVMETVKGKEEAIVQESSGDTEVFRYKDRTSLDTYRTVVSAALEDGAITRAENHLLTKLRRSLGLSLRDHYRVQAQLGKFPKDDNASHSDAEIGNALKELQRKGVVLWCNHHHAGPRAVVPEEIAPGLKQVLGMELPSSAFHELLKQLTRVQLQDVLRENGLPTSGSKDELVSRVQMADLTPSGVLDTLTTDALAAICRDLPGTQVSGSKEQKIRNIIRFYDRLRMVAFDESVDERARFYQFYEALAWRDRENLLANGLIKKDREIEGAFEEATRYLFEEMLGLTLEAMDGSDHADGRFPHPDGRSVFLWDNKSKEETYEFPENHFKQFKRYIRDAHQRVTAFLIIVPDYTEEAEAKTARLKSESGTDSDVCLVRAEDLKWLGENWKAYTKNGRFNPEVLNMTGGLDRQQLQRRLKTLSS